MKYANLFEDPYYFDLALRKLDEETEEQDEE